MPDLVSHDGTRLAYTEVGSGPPLLCLPGGPGRASEYLGDLGGLGATRTLVRLENRATGRSEVPVDLSTLRYDRLAADVEALRVHLGLERADVLGHSAGAIIAQAWAAQHPAAVGHLVLLTPAAALQGGRYADLPAIRERRAAEPWYAAAAEALARLPDAAGGRARELERLTRPFMYGRWDETAQAHAAGADRQVSARATRGFSANRHQVDKAGLLAALAQLDVPVLVVGGELDAMTGVESVHQVASSFPSAQVHVLPAAGHFPWLDDPATLHAVLERFLG